MRKRKGQVRKRGALRCNKGKISRAEIFSVDIYWWFYWSLCKISHAGEPVRRWKVPITSNGRKDGNGYLMHV